MSQHSEPIEAIFHEVGLEGEDMVDSLPVAAGEGRPPGVRLFKTRQRLQREPRPGDSLSRASAPGRLTRESVKTLLRAAHITPNVTPESFGALLRFLGSDREQAAVRYETIRRRLVRLFEWRGFGNPEDLADETIDRVARRIHEGIEVRSSDPYSYFCGVAYLVSKEVGRRVSRERMALECEVRERDGWQPASPVDEPEDDGRLGCLRRCLQRLPDEQRLLVLRYHQESDHIRSRQALSQELGIPMNALRIRVHRIRRKLEQGVRECLRHRFGPR